MKKQQRYRMRFFGLLIVGCLLAFFTTCTMRLIGDEPTPGTPRPIPTDECQCRPCCKCKPECACGRRADDLQTTHSVLVAQTDKASPFAALANPGAFAGQGAPPRGWSMPITVVEVYDGDTLTVGLRMRARVRLLDCWAPELDEKGGKPSRDRLVKLAEGKDGVLFVPREGDGRLDKQFTFGRLLGRIWIGDDASDLSSQMVEGGFATKEKSE